MTSSTKRERDVNFAKYMKKNPGRFPDSVRRPHTGAGHAERMAARTTGNAGTGGKYLWGMLGQVLADLATGNDSNTVPAELMASARKASASKAHHPKGATTTGDPAPREPLRLFSLSKDVRVPALRDVDAKGNPVAPKGARILKVNLRRGVPYDHLDDDSNADNDRVTVVLPGATITARLGEMKAGWGEKTLTTLAAKG